MNDSKLKNILYTATFISFVLFVISFITVKNNSPKAVQSALLNPGLKDNIQAFIIQTPEEIITLRNENQYWTCEKQGIYTFADSKTITGLLNNLTKIRKMYKISDTQQGKIDLKLTEDSAKILTVIDNKGNAVSRLFFGGCDSLTSRINLASQKGKISYETHDDFSTYLTTDLNFWTIPEIFFAIKNPSNLKLKKTDLHTLFSLRHGKILNSIQLPKDAVLVNSVTLKGQYDSCQKTDFYQKQTSEGNVYYYTQNIEPEIIHNNAVFEISEWTYERLTKLLK